MSPGYLANDVTQFAGVRPNINKADAVSIFMW